MSPDASFSNPYRPGAGHIPPYLAGREGEFEQFDRLLDQHDILENMVLTGLRGVGKTVLLDTFKPRALEAGWLWIGTDLSEAVSLSEDHLAIRLLTDLSLVTSGIAAAIPARTRPGFSGTVDDAGEQSHLDYQTLAAFYSATPGLTTDKLKAVLELVFSSLPDNHNRIVFAYDEAQNLSDNSAKDQYPLSVLLDLFQSIQKKGLPFMLVLTGLPTLFPKLVEARTFAERMFRVVTLGRLSEAESREAITKPIDVANCPIQFSEHSVEIICSFSAGYPYFVQFICREVFDAFIQQIETGEEPGVPRDEIQRKLDEDFFAGRWARATDRQRELLWAVASLEKEDDEFTVQELVAKTREVLASPFSSSHANQMLSRLAADGLIYKNRYGRYSFAVPLMGSFILRTYSPSATDSD